MTKIHKHLDTIKAKNDKLVAENKALKDHIRELKSMNSRVRRIPKQPAPAPAPAPEE